MGERTGIDVKRVEQLAELRDVIKALPAGSRQVLRLGPLQEPLCGVCTAINAGKGCAFAAEIRDYHDIGVLHYGELLGEEDLEALAAILELAESCGAGPLVRALAGALAAERSLVVYLLAGWVPPRVRRPVADRGVWPRDAVPGGGS